uniref:Putative kunitz domain protein n=1 Tax=Amblyomma parvum TaxID=251391 RepID=A0A023FXQ2_AMBPA
MKFAALVFLWFWNGAVLEVGGGRASVEPFNWPRSPEVCNREASLVGKFCNPFHERRYFYNRTISRCVLFIPERCDADPDEGNNFGTRKDCMETCMKSSPCLKPRWGTENGTVDGYTYYPNRDFCFPTNYKSKRRFWPERNKFLTEKECYDNCAPERVPKELEG